MVLTTTDPYIIQNQMKTGQVNESIKNPSFFDYFKRRSEKT
jgi:hypothetical protein